jgi:hypothetical protein
MRGGRPLARGRAGAAPERLILHFDTTPIDVHSEKAQAAGHYKRGFNPLLVSCGREVLTKLLRPSNSGVNNANEHLLLLDLALEVLPRSALDGEILARSDSAGPPVISLALAGDQVRFSEELISLECDVQITAALAGRRRGQRRLGPPSRPDRGRQHPDHAGRGRDPGR